jgi:tagatose 1,6-diphosphate aldolase
MPVNLSPGKWQRLRSLTDEQGRFKMLAIDQRDSLRRALARATGQDPREVTAADLTKAKALVTKGLAPYATAVLTDPVYGYPPSIEHLPPRVGLLLAYEETGYETAGPSHKGRKSRLIEGWSVEKAQRAGADAVKLLVYYHPDGSDEAGKHQQELVQRVGEECEHADLPFLLELVSYPLAEDSSDTAGFARRKPDVVIRSAAEFSQALYRVDILKLEFPADLKWAKEFSSGAFDSKERQAVYSLGEVRAFCRQLDEAAAMPWVILSAGVDIEEFLVQVDLATEAGSSGFLCGRAIWKDAINLYSDEAKVEHWLKTQGAHNFLRANAHAHRALPWACHRKYC